MSDPPTAHHMEGAMCVHFSRSCWDSDVTLGHQGHVILMFSPFLGQLALVCHIEERN